MIRAAGAAIAVARARGRHHGAVAPLRGFRFLQVGNGPIERRAGTLLSLLGAEVIALLDRATHDRVLAAPVALHHTGRQVVVAAPAEAGRIERSGVIDGSGLVPAGPGVVSVAGLPTGARGWAASGAMALTGTATGPALQAPGDQAAGLWAAGAVLEALTDLGGRRVAVDGPALTAERAAFTGLTRRGSVSPAGSCRLLATADGWVAVNLPRRTDLDLIDAWLGEPTGPDPWATVERLLAHRPGPAVVLAGQELGVAVAHVTDPEAAATDAQASARGLSFPLRPFLVDGDVAPLPPACAAPPLWHLAPVAATAQTLAGARVVDFSSLWAGPLATSLLVAAGADVVKVESTLRPDGARAGDPDFFALLNHGKRSVAIDFGDPAAPRLLANLADSAALVVEASRPRAFEQLGLEPDAWRRRHPGRSWVSMTAYGRTGPWRQWSGFGDDAAVAGGMVVQPPGPASAPLLCADAYADPVTGLHAAVTAAAGLIGAGGTFDIALREVVNHLLAGDEPAENVGDVGESPLIAAPRARPVPGPAPTLGADNHLLGASVGGRSVVTRQTAEPSTSPTQEPT